MCSGFDHQKAVSPAATAGWYNTNMRCTTITQRCIALLSLVILAGWMELIPVAGWIGETSQGHVISSNLVVNGNVTSVDSSGNYQNLLDLIQKQSALILQQTSQLSQQISLMQQLQLQLAQQNATLQAVQTQVSQHSASLERQNSTLQKQQFFVPTIQSFTGGTGTYFTPVAPRLPLYLKIRMVGGGGGGAGGAISGGSDGGAGTATTFGALLTAGGGSGGIRGGLPGGVGGTNSISLRGVITLVSAVGSAGASGTALGATGYCAGGEGGVSVFGGAGSGGSPNNNALSAAANSGSGGGGGGTTPYPGTMITSGSGGGAGGYIEAIIINPGNTYSYTIGAGGALGSVGPSGTYGGNGGSGYLIVEEHYQ